MTVSILHERREVADCLPLVPCASLLSNFLLKGERAIASSPACERGLRRGFAMSAGMAALHLSNVPARGRPMSTPLLLSDPFALSELRPRRGGAEPSCAGVAALHLIPQPAGYAITSDLENVVCSPSRMASRFISNVSEVQS